MAKLMSKEIEENKRKGLVGYVKSVINEIDQSGKPFTIERNDGLDYNFTDGTVQKVGPKKLIITYDY